MLYAPSNFEYVINADRLSLPHFGNFKVLQDIIGSIDQRLKPCKPIIKF